MDLERASGLLLHPSSLPSAGPIGDLGPAACAFIDWLASAGQSVWQVLPLNPTGLGNSPYSAVSAFAGNTSLISLEKLAEDGWIEKSAIQYEYKDVGKADFDAIQSWKMPLLRKSAEKFLSLGKDSEQADRFSQFCRAQRSWLEDYVLFQALRVRAPGKGWHDWPQELMKREPAAMQKARAELAHDMEIERVLQFAFFTQWDALRNYAHTKRVKMFGDIAIFVNDDSADVWSHPYLFKLDDDLR